ncbi:hypothetical protein [Microbacterium indicum]|uniref:hypothetical protein n=1 Tax=Microbacterium indicum TaxID=358100 RepID=UPI0003F6A800|nr:hypothetical protein [Microbacterium indicum]
MRSEHPRPPARRRTVGSAAAHNSGGAQDALTHPSRRPLAIAVGVLCVVAAAAGGYAVGAWPSGDDPSPPVPNIPDAFASEFDEGSFVREAGFEQSTVWSATKRDGDSICLFREADGSTSVVACSAPGSDDAAVLIERSRGDDADPEDETLIEFSVTAMPDGTRSLTIATGTMSSLGLIDG